MSTISKQLSSISRAGRKQPAPSTEIRLVLLGKTGSGKSSTANSILGRKVFDSRIGSSSVTYRCRRVTGEVRGRSLTILDTPGLLDTHQTVQEVQRELRRSVSLLYPGPHVFLLVIQIGRFTPEEKEVVRQIKQAIGSNGLTFCVVVFTHGDLLEEGRLVKHCVIDGCRDLVELVACCGGRYCVFNNISSKNKDQVSDLLAVVDSMMNTNGGTYYASPMLQRAEDELALELQEERRLRLEKEELLKKKQEATLKELYKQEIEMAQQQSKMDMEELKKEQELARKKAEKLAIDQEEAFRRTMDESDRKQKEGKIQEMLRVMEIRREEEQTREALRNKLNKATIMLKEQAETEDKLRRTMEEKIQKDKMDREKKERERELQQLQKEQVIRQREEMKREALQKELDKLTLSLQEQSRKEEEMRGQMEALLRREREESQRERDIQMENQRAEKRRTEALKQELKLIKRKIEQQENLQRQLEENQRREREMATLKAQCQRKCFEPCAEKGSAESHSTVTTLTGYVQEMGLLGLNTALQSVGATCCIQ